MGRIQGLAPNAGAQGRPYSGSRIGAKGLVLCRIPSSNTQNARSGVVVRPWL